MDKTVKMHNMYYIVYIMEILLLKPCDTFQWVTLKYYSGRPFSKLDNFQLFWYQQLSIWRGTVIIGLKVAISVRFNCR